MRALVVFESLYGNTAAVGKVVAGSLRSRGYDVSVGSVANVSPVETDAVDLLIVGGPTHAHGMSRASTRKVAATDAKNTYTDPTTEPGLRDWLAAIPLGRGRAAAAFDTRFDKPVLLTGSAAKSIARRLEHLGFRVIVEPESFLVTGANRLKEGEIERATAWVKVLAESSREVAA
jgi:hypothetical protein